MSLVSQAVIRQFNNSQFLRMHISALGGFIIGAKACDLLLFNDENYEVLREEMEEEYWTKNGIYFSKKHFYVILGEPTEIEPYIVKAKNPNKEGEMRKSWIYIMYEKDKLIKKAVDLDK